jgi:hypothetical protein
MLKRLVMPFTVIALLIALSEAVLPALASTLIAKGLASRITSEDIKIVAEKHPALLMLGGQFDSLAVEGSDIKTERIVISQLNAKMTDVQLDMNALLAQKFALSL